MNATSYTQPRSTVAYVLAKAIDVTGDTNRSYATLVVKDTSKASLHRIRKSLPLGVRISRWGANCVTVEIPNRLLPVVDLSRLSRWD